MSSFVVQLSHLNGDTVRLNVEQSNEVQAILVASDVFPDYKVESVATKLNFPFKVKQQ